MNRQVNIDNFQNIIQNLTPESQIYLLNMANMAKVAEDGKNKELKEKRQKSDTAVDKKAG